MAKALVCFFPWRPREARADFVVDSWARRCYYLGDLCVFLKRETRRGGDDCLPLTTHLKDQLIFGHATGAWFALSFGLKDHQGIRGRPARMTHLIARSSPEETVERSLTQHIRETVLPLFLVASCGQPSKATLKVTPRPVSRGSFRNPDFASKLLHRKKKTT